MFESKARGLAVTKQDSLQIVLHEEMMTELQKQTAAMEKMVQSLEFLKVNFQNPTTVKTATKTTRG